MKLDRELLAEVAMANPHLSGAVLRMCRELHEGGLPQDPAVLRRFGEHIRDLGAFVASVASAIEHPAPVVVDLNDPQTPSQH